jgi:hypothetical protein
MSYEIPLSTFHVLLEDGREFKVDTDQRDQRRGFLLAKVDPEEDAIGGLRAIAWAALHRTRQLEGMAWPEFDRLATWVLPEQPDADSPEGGAFVDPTEEDGAV